MGTRECQRAHSDGQIRLVEFAQMDQFPTLFLQVTTGFTLLLAAAAKGFNASPLRNFLTQLGLRTQWAGLVAKLAPIFEALLGIGLLSGLFPLQMAAATTLLSCVFTTVLIAAFRKRLPIGCSCFGRLDSEPVSALAISRSVLLLVASTWLLLLRLFHSPTTWISLTAHDLNVGMMTLSAVAAISSVTLFALLEKVVSLERQKPNATLQPLTRAADR
jgi:hypothetical protein